ncbi:MAG: hypothetical protein ACN6OP_26830 [Pseudomonadales bacterium]
MTDIEKDLANPRGQIHGLCAVLGPVVACLPDSTQFEQELTGAAEMTRSHALAEAGEASDFVLQGQE